MGAVRASICIATYDKSEYLKRSLASIFRQPQEGIEVIVVDDRSPDRRNFEVCGAFPGIHYLRLNGPSGYMNPARARNTAYRAATGDVVIAQSDDVVHVTPDSIERLVQELVPGSFVIANVFNTDLDGNRIPGNVENPGYHPLIEYTGPTNPRPFFFLGSLFRKDLYAIGGNDEEFVAPGCEDQWFANCLMGGLGLKPIFTTSIVGHHLQHYHQGTHVASQPSHNLYAAKYADAKAGRIPWQSCGGAWSYDS